MNAKRAKILCLLLSLAWHGGLILAFSHYEQNREDARWSGGFGDTPGVIRISIGNSEEHADRTVSEEDEPSTTPTPVQNRSTLKTTVKTQAPQTTATAGSAVKSGNVMPGTKTATNAGQGRSDTPAGGQGNGMDPDGTISENAPNAKAAILKKIARHKSYPYAARANRIEGIVRVQFQVNADGTLAFTNIQQSSGHALLDQAALKTIRKAVPLPFYSGPISLELEYVLPAKTTGSEAF